MEGAHAVGTYTDYADKDLQLLLEEVQIRNEVWGKLSSVGDLGEVGVPAGEGDILRSNGGELTRVGQLGSTFPGGGTVVGTGLDFGESVENVSFHEMEFGDAVEHDGVAEGGQVYPAGAAGAAGGGT